MAKSFNRTSVAQVLYNGSPAGAIAWDDARGIGNFEYEPSFIRQGIQLAPLMMPLDSRVYSFPELNKNTFKGLPGLLSDSLPDRFGNAIIDLWLQQQGKSAENFNPIERLCYIGKRGMGALEYKPALMREKEHADHLEIENLVELAGQILNDRFAWSSNINKNTAEAVREMIKIGSSAGGARAKAIIAWNPKTGEVRSGQVPVPDGFQPWILKFDGVHDKALGDPEGYGRIEYAYHLMAVAAGIKMNECRLFEENGRAHFMTRRFDRGEKGQKIHMQSLCAIAHMDFNAPGVYGYEQAFQVLQQLKAPHSDFEEMFRRMLFNIFARIQDDHTRNIVFLMDDKGVWHLSPYFDVIWSYNPSGEWTNLHQLSINGKRDNFVKSDVLDVADQFNVKKANEIIKQVDASVVEWEMFAKKAAVAENQIKHISQSHRKI